MTRRDVWPSNKIRKSEQVSNSQLVISAQAIRAFTYGFSAILLGHILATEHKSAFEIAVVLSSIVFGSALTSFILVKWGERVGRIRAYKIFYLLLSLAGLAIFLIHSPWTIAAVGLLGVLSTDANDNGPATTLEQAVLADDNEVPRFARIFGKYNAISALSGSLGALSQAAFARLFGATSSYREFILLVPLGLLGWFVARKLNGSTLKLDITSDINFPARSPSLDRPLLQLSLLFALDSAAGGLTTTSWLAYYLTSRYHTSITALGFYFFAFSILASVSMLLAPLIAEKIGLVVTMVGSHVLSNLFFITAAFCRSLNIALLFLLLRAAFSQMDIPTRQALLMSAVPKESRLSAAAVTNTARNSIRPIAPSAGIALQHVAIFLPLFTGGAIKICYDVLIYSWAKKHNYLARTME